MTTTTDPESGRDVGWYAEAVVAMCHAVGDIRRRSAALLGISASELLALTLICDAEQTTPAHMTPGQLATELDVTSGSVTPILNHLVEAGYVQRTQHPSDRRRFLISAKPGGHHALAWARGELHAALGTVVERVASNDGGAVAEFLTGAVESLNRQQPTR